MNADTCHWMLVSRNRLITARDLVTGRLTHRDYPVVKLT
jgi:hypothetical protein